MRSRTAARFGTAVCCALLTLIGTVARGESSLQAKDDIQARDAWIRWLPANLPGAGYMTLTNTGSTERLLIGAGSPDYGDVSFHRTRNSNGMNEMTPVDSIVLKPHASVRFAEGGYHLMLLQPRRSVHPGDKVLVTLRFSGGQTISVTFDVRGRDQ